jgi:Cu/Ag efflux protein CusF
VLADVFEQDIAMVRNGSRAEVSINAYPERKFEGRVTFVYPTLSAPTRTVPVRIELANPGGLLKPAMFADVVIGVEPNGPKLAVPISAVIDSGKRRVVLVQSGEGRFESREVKLGARGHEYVEVLDGVREGENVVVSANFLIDSESNLKAALGGLNTTPATAKVSHRATGTVQEIDDKGNTLSIAHGPIASLKWPSMTMEFAVSHNTLVKGLQAGAAITFEFVERQPGEWVIVSLERGKAASAKAEAKKP